jgi:site-specific recombinase XerD
MSAVPEHLFDSYLNDYLRRDHAATAQSYGKLLKQFEDWLAGRGITNTFDSEQVVEFLEIQPWSNSTRNLFLSGLRGWAKLHRAKLPVGESLAEIQHWRGVEKRMERVMGLRGYKVTRKEKIPLTKGELETLFGQTADTWLGNKRADTLLWLYLWFGWRAEEFKLIKNIDYEKGELMVATEKAGGERRLYFDWFTRCQLEIAESDKLFELPTGQIRSRLRKWTKIIEPTKANLHILRHTFCTYFAPLTDEWTLKRMMGHIFSSSTEIYAHAQQEKVRELMLDRHYLLEFEPEEYRHRRADWVRPIKDTTVIEHGA